VAPARRRAHRPDWGGRPDPTQYPIQFFDVLLALQVMPSWDA
jgi:hypothetical protein